MSDPLDIVVECDSPEQVWSVLLDINNNQLPRGVKKPFSDLIMSWMVRYPDAVILSMVRGKSVRQLFGEYATEPRPMRLEGGERDGVTWTLYDPPADPAG